MNPDLMHAELDEDELQRTLEIRKAVQSSAFNLSVTLELALEHSDLTIPEMTAIVSTLASLSKMTLTMNINDK